MFFKQFPTIRNNYFQMEATKMKYLEHRQATGNQCYRRLDTLEFNHHHVVITQQWTRIFKCRQPVSYTHLDVYKRQPQYCRHTSLVAKLYMLHSGRLFFKGLVFVDSCCDVICVAVLNISAEVCLEVMLCLVYEHTEECKCILL